MKWKQNRTSADYTKNPAYKYMLYFQDI